MYKMRQLRTFCGFTVLLMLNLVHGIYAQVPDYKNSSLPINLRVKNLLSRMTTKEKIGQTIELFGWNSWTRQGNEILVSDEFKSNLGKYQVGAYYGTLRVDPWTEVTIGSALSSEESAITTNMLQKYNMEHSRLGIPILFQEDVTHGLMCPGSTVYPTSIAVASTWNTDLARRMWQTIASEIRSLGGSAVCSPNVDVVRDPRWGRIEETYGEDPYLNAAMGVAAVKGLQGENLNSDHTVAATVKHFVQALPEGGHNAGFVNMGERELRETYLYPFQKCVQAGAAMLMAAYSDVNGVPCNMNKQLLTNILRNEWGFKGTVVSDAYSITELYNFHRVAEDLPHAASLAIKAGVDMDMSGAAYMKGIQAAIDKGLLTMQVLDTAVSRVLRLKFQLGLFEKPYVDVAKAKDIFNTSAKKELALKIARQGMVLLKNDKQMLPLKKNLKSIAVIGPNADNIMNQLGDYTSPQKREWIVTVLEGIKQKVSPNTQVFYEKGCDIRNPSKADFEKAIAVAQKAEIIIAVVGGSSARLYKSNAVNQNTGQAQVQKDALNDMDCGEGFDRIKLGLSGVQSDLIAALKATGKPLVVVLINGRPLSIPKVYKQTNAMLEAWYCGSQGGNAVADILFGDYNPTGRLPVSVAREVGQLPVFYGHRNQHRSPYVEMDAEPMFPFGFGLSYTTFEYKNLKLSAKTIKRTEPLQVSVDVTNTGKMAGSEVVQLYIHDEVASVSRPILALRGFRKIELSPGETKTVMFTLTPDDLSMYDINMKWVEESGTFEILVGHACNDIRQKGNIEVID
jgi:beta-glucosidase